MKTILTFCLMLTTLAGVADVVPIVRNKFTTNNSTASVIINADILNNTINSNKLDSATRALLGGTNGGGTSDALTNNDTRAVTFTASTFTVGDSTGSNVINLSGDQGFIGAGPAGFVFQDTTSSIHVPGGVEFSGTNISIGTIPSNRLGFDISAAAAVLDASVSNTALAQMRSVTNRYLYAPVDFWTRNITFPISTYSNNVLYIDPDGDWSTNFLTYFNGDADLSVGSRVLIGYSASADGAGGIYTVTDTGEETNQIILTRATDMDEDSEIVNGAAVFAMGGGAWSVFKSAGAWNPTNNYGITMFPSTYDTPAQFLTGAPLDNTFDLGSLVPHSAIFVDPTLDYGAGQHYTLSVATIDEAMSTYLGNLSIIVLAGSYGEDLTPVSATPITFDLYLSKGAVVKSFTVNSNITMNISGEGTITNWAGFGITNYGTLNISADTISGTAGAIWNHGGTVQVTAKLMATETNAVFKETSGGNTINARLDVNRYVTLGAAPFVTYSNRIVLAAAECDTDQTIVTNLLGGPLHIVP